MAKDFTYRGKTTEDLLKMDIREFAKFLQSRRRRTVMKNFDKIQKFILACKKKIQQNKKIKTHNRDMIIVPQMVGMKIQVYNGKEYNPIEVNWDMLGHYLGEFSLTRKKVEHSAPGIGATRSSASLSVK